MSKKLNCQEYVEVEMKTRNGLHKCQLDFMYENLVKKEREEQVRIIIDKIN